MSFSRVPARGGNLNTASSTSIDSSAFVSVAGRPICGYVGWEGGNTTVSVSDLAGNTYVVGTPQVHGNGDQVIAPFYCLSSLGHAANVVSVSFLAARSYRVMQAEEYSHAGVVQFVGFAYGECTTAATATTDAIAFTGTAGLLFVGCKAYNGTTITAGGSLTLIAQQGTFGAAADQILSADGSYTASMTNSSTSSLSVVAMAFKEVSAGPTVSTITGTTATEGSAVVFTATMSGTGGLTDAYSWSGTAGSGDYTQTLTDDMFTTTGGTGSVTVSGGNITVPSAVTAFTVTVPTTGDTLYEGSETIRLVIGGVTASSGTINDDDAPPTITGTVSQTVTAGSPVVITYTLSAASGLSSTYTLTVTDGTKTGGVDFTMPITSGMFSNGVTISGSTVTVPAGVSSFTITIPTAA